MRRDIYATGISDKDRAEAAKAEAWLKGLPERDYADLRIMLIDTPVKEDEAKKRGEPAEDDVIADWIEDHDGNRCWLDLLSIAYLRTPKEVG